jgi:hypothetical protein
MTNKASTNCCLIQFSIELLQRPKLVENKGNDNLRPAGRGVALMARMSLSTASGGQQPPAGSEFLQHLLKRKYLPVPRWYFVILIAPAGVFKGFLAEWPGLLHWAAGFRSLMVAILRPVGYGLPACH